MRWSAGLVLILGCAIPMWTQERENPQLTVVVYDGVEASLPLLGNAELEAGRVLGEARMDIRWVNCLPERAVASCNDRAESTWVSLRVVRRPRSLSDRAMGVAFVANGEGKYADIFFDHVEKLRAKNAGANLGTILGYVMAHEIGHLLLGSNSHSRSGIMQGEWHADELRTIALGRLLFTAEQAQRLRERVAARARGNGPEPSLAEMRGEEHPAVPQKSKAPNRRDR
jgi:hypothetical protein